MPLIQLSNHRNKSVHVFIPDDYVRPVLSGGKTWVEALRSGKYKQGRSRLATKDGKYCCLGVWCVTKGYEQLVDFTGFPTFRIPGSGRTLSSLPADDSLLDEGLLPQSVFVRIGDERLYKWDVLNDYHMVPFSLMAEIAEVVYVLQ